MAKIRKAVTMSDIAKRLNVSTVTVSKALSGQKGVSNVVRDQIIETAAEMGYRFSGDTKEREEQKNRRLGVLIPEGALAAYDSFYWRLYQAVSEQAIRRNCFAGYENLTSDMIREKRCPKMITDQMVDGVILIGQPAEGYAGYLRSVTELPVVYLDFYEKDRQTDCFISDSFYGTYCMTQYLIEKGHRDIAFIGSVLATESITDRYFGFRRAMLEQGLCVEEDHVIPDRDRLVGTRENYTEYKLPEKMPTAFVCNCDIAARNLITQLEKMGLNVPGDVSVTGFDDYPQSEMQPGLTTYAVDLQAMAGAAVHSLIRQIGNEAFEKGIHIVEGRMIERESVREI